MDIPVKKLLKVQVKLLSIQVNGTAGLVLESQVPKQPEELCVSTMELRVTISSDSRHSPQEGSDGSHQMMVTVQSKLDGHVMKSSVRGRVTLMANELSHGRNDSLVFSQKQTET